MDSSPSGSPTEPYKPNEPRLPTEPVGKSTSNAEGHPAGVTPPDYIQTPKVEKPEREGLKSIITTVAIIVLAPLIALFLTAFVFQSYEVDGASMETTLQHQDRLIVLKVPRTWSKITKNDYIPNRGDVIIFDKDDAPELGESSKRQLVKRVIGLPGDRVVVKDGEITVYNKENPEGFKPDRTLPYGRLINITPGEVDVTVQEGHMFVAGDNRTNSLDSRIFGPIPAEDVVGKLGARIFPFNKFKLF
jgi:signal peptidase I